LQAFWSVGSDEERFVDVGFAEGFETEGGAVTRIAVALALEVLVKEAIAFGIIGRVG
jgi:hypothetical protein